MTAGPAGHGAVRLPHDWFPDPVPSNVVLDEEAWLWSSLAFAQYRSTRPTGVRIGRRSGIYPGVMFDLGPEGEVSIGADCMLGEVTFATNHRIVVGDHCLIARCAVLADGPACTPAPSHRNAQGDEPVITLEDNCWVGQHAVVLAGAHVGTGAIVAMRTVVDFTVPPYAIVAGDPARVVGDTRGRR